MATTLDYIEFVCEQIGGVGAVRYRKMFGEYMVYVNDKPLLLVCDNTVFVKILPELADLMAGAETALPYEGSREHYILDIEDKDLTRAVIAVLEPLTPLPKLKKKTSDITIMTDQSNFPAHLTDKDAACACAFAGQVVRESRESDRWYPYFDEALGLLSHKNSLVRNRAIEILAANARWDAPCKLDAAIDAFLAHVTDEKPITARQCIKALPEIVAAKPQLIPQIRAALEKADLTGYRDSMRPLILKDILAALREL